MEVAEKLKEYIEELKAKDEFIVTASIDWAGKWEEGQSPLQLHTELEVYATALGALENNEEGILDEVGRQVKCLASWMRKKCDGREV